MKQHICILQTSFAKRDDTVAYLKERLPDVRVTFITDDALLADIRAAGGPTQSVRKRMTLHAMAAEAMGATVILNSCSTVGEVADVYAQVVSVPVMKIDAPMAQAAAEVGGRIALVATLPTTVAPSRHQIQKAADAMGHSVTFDEFLVQPAWEALAAGNRDRHNELLIQQIRQLDTEGYQAIVMCQVSMRALLPALDGVKTPVLCSFYSGLDAVVEKVKSLEAAQ